MCASIEEAPALFDDTFSTCCDELGSTPDRLKGGKVRDNGGIADRRKLLAALREREVPRVGREVMGLVQKLLS